MTTKLLFLSNSVASKLMLLCVVKFVRQLFKYPLPIIPIVLVATTFYTGGYIMSCEEHVLSSERNSSAQHRSISKFSKKDSNEYKDEKSHLVTKIH